MMNQKDADELKELIRLTDLISEIYEQPITLTNFNDDSIIYASKRFTLMTGFESNTENSVQTFTYKDIIHPKDQKITSEINQNGKKNPSQNI